MSVFNQLMMKNKSNKEIFSNILDYDKTMFLCHFEQNLDNLGNHSLNFADGGYNYNSDAKFGNYSVANTYNGMVWWNNNITNENKTLECWMKPLSEEEEYYFCLAFANNSWGSHCGVEIKNYDNGCALFDNSNSEYFNLPDNFKQNDWNNIAITYSSIDSSYITMTLWINGEFCKSMQIYYHADVARFVAVGVYNQQRCSCLIDELVVHNYVRYTKNFEVQQQSYVIGYEYYEVDYIETTGTQYINTEVSAPNGFIIKTKISISSNGGDWRCICGCHEPTAPHKRNFVMINYGGRVSNNNIVSCGQGDGDKWGNDILLSFNTKYTIEASNIYNNTYIKINGTNATLISGDSPSNSYSSRNLYLFADNNGSSLSNPAQFFSGKIYATQIFVGDAIVRDYVPVYNSTLQQYCLLDKVENKIYLNNGTGTITGGND